MSESKQTTTAIFVIMILASGVFFTWFTWHLTATRLSREALDQARIVAQSINIKRLAHLKGNPTDLNTPDYVRIKDQLTQIRLSHKTCRFLYLMGRKKDGTVFFFLDSQPSDSKDYAAPGLVYGEVSEEYLYTFDTGKELTVGPIKDRWGILVTSLVPIYKKDKAKLIAVLGMDIDAKNWKGEIISQCAYSVGLTVSIILLITFLFMLNRNRQMLKIQYEEKNRIANELQDSLAHVKTLQGLLPICASCKKIKDDKGTWRQIESYIEKHSEVQFTHGICEECAEKLYGDEIWYQSSKKDAEDHTD